MEWYLYVLFFNVYMIYIYIYIILLYNSIAIYIYIRILYMVFIWLRLVHSGLCLSNYGDEKKCHGQRMGKKHVLSSIPEWESL